MYTSSMLFMLCATTALAGPIVNHQHNHMDFHQRKGRDNGAAGLLSLLESEAPAGSFPPPGAPGAPAVAVVDAPTVYTTVTVDGQTAASSSPPAPPPAASSSSPAQPPANNDVKKKISGPPVAQPAAPQQPPPAASSAPASSGNGLPSAPTTYQADLTSDDQVYKDLALLHHNIHRANHSLPGLEWNETLYETAKATAQTCQYGHTQPVPAYGQNIAAGNTPGNVSADITNGFYNGEIGLFQQAIGEFGNDSPDMSDFEHWGHATQMLWKSTTSVGCYTASCAPAGQDPLSCGPGGQSYLPPLGCNNGGGEVGTRAFFLVCDYYPPGNYPDQYSMVPAPNGQKPFVEATQGGVSGL